MSTLILASQSKARQEMLHGAGLSFMSKPADLDEETLIKSLQERSTPLAEIPESLAQAKALAISQQTPNALVIGSDQILEFDGRILSKSATPAEAIEKLKTMSGKSHRLFSGVALARNNEILWSTTDQATLKMHSFDDEFWAAYESKAGVALTTSVGGYWLEDIGSWLFEKIKGDHFTILGMPLLPLLGYLRHHHGAGYK